MKKVIVINPRGIKGDEEYLNGMVSALYKRDDIDVSLYTNFYYEISDKEIPYKCHRYFFKNSEKMVPSAKRNAVRATEYICQYLKLVNIIKREKPDVVHIHWSVMSKVDPIFFRKIKKYCGKLVYTAHNVLPHINSEKYIDSYGKIYNCADVIIVHGQSIYEEFSKLYPQYKEKVYISRHGKKNTLKEKIDYNDAEIQKCEQFINKYDRMILSFGMIYYDKGMDRIIRAWKEIADHKNCCMVIAGKTQPSYPELDELGEYVKSQEDIIFLDQYISNNLLNYFLKEANLIVLPYRHASMSGVMLTAAAEAIPILCTNVGSLAEYIDDGCGWVVPNDDKAICENLQKILNGETKDSLAQMGKKFQQYVNKRYDWNTIVDEIVKDCY